MTTKQAEKLVTEFNAQGRSRGVMAYIAAQELGGHLRLFFKVNAFVMKPSCFHSVSINNSTMERARAHFAGFLSAY